jgi:hypothetical protein
MTKGPLTRPGPWREHGRRSVLDGAGTWDEQRLAAAGFQMYRARTTEVSVLTGEGPDIRVAVPL